MTTNNVVLKGELITDEENYLTNTTKSKAKKNVRTAMEKEEIIQKLRAISNPRDSVLCSTLYMTGLRVSEVINIKKEDIDFKNGFITARWQKSRKWNNRKVALHQQLAPILAMYCAKLTQEEYLFPITRQRVFQITKKHFGVSPHKFRHSYALHFLRTSTDELKLARLQSLLGHRDIKTTMEYVHAHPEHNKQALQEVDFL